MESDCCGSPPYLGKEIHGGIGICGECKEWADFHEEEIQCGCGRWTNEKGQELRNKNKEE